MRVVPFTFSSHDASCIDTSRKDAVTKRIDKAIVTKGPGVLLSLFGYNNGAAQFVHIFNAAAYPAANAEPLHTFAIDASNNFSVIVPVSGIGFDVGLIVALSTTDAVYTAGASKDLSFCGTLNSNF